MSETEFNTLLRLIADLGNRMESGFQEVRIEFKTEIQNQMKTHDKKQLALHFAVMKALKGPFIDHEKRITNLESTVFN